jgi:hypothetical protein
LIAPPFTTGAKNYALAVVELNADGKVDKQRKMTKIIGL